MRRFGAALLALVLAAGVLAALPAERAGAQQASRGLISNLGQADNSFASTLQDHAQAFTTGGSPWGYTLTSVGVEFAAISSGLSSSDLTVGIYTDRNDLAGSAVGALTNPGSFPVSTSDQVLVFTSAGIELAADTTYYLVIDSAVDNTIHSIRDTAAGAEDSGGLDGWSIGDVTFFRPFGGSTWQQANGAMKVSFNGTANPFLVSNFGQANTSTGNHQAHDHAQAFTTGGNADGYTLTAVHFAFPTISDGNLASKMTVTVNSDNGGEPGTAVATLTKPATITAGTNTFTHAGLQLDPATTYWVVIDNNGNASGVNHIQNTASDAEDAGGAAGFSISDTSLYRTASANGSWTSFGLSRKIAIVGTAVESGNTPRLVSNLGEVAADHLVLTQDAAQAFTTGSNHGGYTVTGVDLRLHAISDAALESKLTVTVNSDGGTEPGEVVGTLTNPALAVSSTPAKYTFTHSGLKLEPDTTYWVVADSSGVGGGNSLSTTASDAENAGGAAGWSIADRGRVRVGGSWRNASNGRSLHIGVTGVARPAPPPKPPGVPATLSNLGEADGGAHSLNQTDRAVSFRTGGNGHHHVLESVELSVVRVTDSDINQGLRVQVMADSGGAPDLNRVLTTLTSPTVSVSNTEQTYTFTYAGDDGSGLRLEPETTYWVVVGDAWAVNGHQIEFRGTTSASERLVGLPSGWSIGNNHRTLASISNTWGTHSEPLKVGLNLGAADDPFVQFRTCEGTVSGNTCSTGWVVANYNRYDPPPTITLTEGGPAMTYQWRAVDPQQRRHFYVTDQVGEPLSHFGGYIGAGGPDRDRLICHTGVETAKIGDPIVYVPLTGDASIDYPRIGYGSTAGHLLDRHDGCHFKTQPIYEHDPNKWRPVSVAAGQDSDAFDHVTFLVHSPNSLGHYFYNDEGEIEYAPSFAYPETHVPLVIRDDDEWEQDLVFSVDDGATWTSVEDGGLSLAFPNSLNTGVKAHSFWVRLKHDPATLGARADATKRFSIFARFPDAPSGTSYADRDNYRVWLTSPAAEHLHSFRSGVVRSSFGSVTVSYTPIQVEINVGDNVTGSVRFEVEGYQLYERNDNQISTKTPPDWVRTKSFSFHRTLGSCVGCQLLPEDLPDPVVERVGELSYANLSDTGIDLSWPLVVGAEGYEVRYWSTTSPFPGVPAEEAWFGAEPSEPAWNIRHLEPDTEYRAVVYYQDHGATQLSTASPVIRFTTLSAGAPTQAEPASVIVERVPEASISADGGTITEGEDATFTVTVDPAPDAPLDVKVHLVAPAAGDVVDAQYLGTRTVNVSTTGSATFTVPTVDNAHWAANGMLSATVDFGDGYRRSAFGSYASVHIGNNDLPPPPPVQLKAVSDTTATLAWKPQADGATYLVVWHKSHSGIPTLTEVTTTATEYEITGLEPDSHYAVSVVAGTTNLRQMTVRTLAAGATPKTFEVDFETPAPNTSVPTVSVTPNGDVTEGADAGFTVTANPAPEADLDVAVTVSQSGEFGAATGQRTVTIPAAGFAALTVATANDDTDEADGSVTVTVDADPDGGDYLVSPTQAAATVAVSDDDGGHTVDPGVVAQVRALASQTHHGTAHVNRWNRVLVAFGEHDGTGVTGGAMTAAQAQDMADRHSSNVWDLVVAELIALEATPQLAPPPTPEISITAGGDVTEGGDAVFTVTATPAPAAGLDVSVTVTQSGDYAASTGARTVTVPTSGTATFTVATQDDTADEPDGSVTATVNGGAGYTVSATQGAAAVAVDDDDDPPAQQQTYTADPAVVAKVKALASQTQHGAAHVNRWNRVLVAFGAHDGTGVTGGAMTAAQAQQMADAHSSPVWDEVAAELTALEAAPQQQTPPPPPPTPEVSVTAAGGVTEGGSAAFTVTASPAPTANLDVTVTVTASGDWGAATGQRTVTIPTSGSVTLTVATTDDQADEPDGSLTVTVDVGSGYTVSSAQGAATAAVADDDPPPAVEQDQTDDPDDAALTACEGKPTLLISSPQASRSDTAVDFEVSLSCIPSGSPMILLSPVRDGKIGENVFVALSADRTTATVTVDIGTETQLGLALVWGSGLANREAQADVHWTD